MSIALSPGQAVWIHGMLNPKRRLTWTDVLERGNLNLKSLTKANITLSALHTLQPDPVQWIAAGKMELDDCPVAAYLWGAHPIRHFHVDLGDMASTRWTSDLLSRMNVTYQDLVDIGLTPESMRLFTHITLVGWSTLGLTKEHVDWFTDPQVTRLFGMSKQDVVRSLR